MDSYRPPVGLARFYPCMFLTSLFRLRLLLAALALVSASRAAEDSLVVPESNDYVGRGWITDQGLPHNVVTRIQQDRDGFLWLATPAGLTRFDGREFKIFLPPERGGGGRNIRDLTVLEDGTVVFLPASGGVWQLQHGVLSEHPASRDLRDETLRELHAEPHGALWFGTAQDVVRWENGRVERFGSEQGIQRRTTGFSWATDDSGRTWLGGPDFVGFYREGKLVPMEQTGGIGYRVAAARTGGVWVWGSGLQRCRVDRLERLADAPWPAGQSSVRAIFEDPEGVVWIGTSRSGAFRFDGRQFESLPGVGVSVEHFTTDHEGSLWVATDGNGIRRFRTKVFSLVEGAVSSVCEDADGAIWLAAGLAGIVRWKNGHAEPFGFSVGRPRTPLFVTAVCADPGGRLWMATPFGLFQTTVDDPHASRRVDPSLRGLRVMFCAENGDVWVAGGGALGWYRADVFTSLADGPIEGDAVTSIAEQPSGHVWIGTARGHLYEIVDGRARRAEVGAGNSGAAIHAMLFDPSGAMWLGTTEGLVLAEKGKTHRFTEADGLPDEIVLQLLPGGADHLWLGTPRGLYRIARAELMARAQGGEALLNPIAHGPEQGLSGISPVANHFPSAARDRHGTLWFCTYRGGIGIHLDRLVRDAPPPPVLIDELRVDDRVVHPSETLRLPPRPEQIVFRFAALSFAAPEQVRLRHRLEGFETEWVDTAPDRSARYTKLPPGEYRLRVTACNSEGKWNERGATLAFTVMPAWWQTMWFNVAVVLGSAGAIGGVVRFWSQRKLRLRLQRLEREHALEKERARISRDMHDELGGSVTGINLLVQRLRTGDGAESNSLVELLERRVRRLTLELERVVWTVSPTNTSLDQLAAFIERFARNLFADSPIRCRVSGHERIPAVPVHPETQHHVLAVTKEAINNVLKHSRGHDAVIEMQFTEGTFVVAIRDNGIGFTPEAQEHSERNGLRNMRSRIQETGGTIEMRSAPGAGTEIAFRVPISSARQS